MIIFKQKLAVSAEQRQLILPINYKNLILIYSKRWLDTKCVILIPSLLLLVELF